MKNEWISAEERFPPVEMQVRLKTRDNAILVGYRTYREYIVGYCRYSLNEIEYWQPMEPVKRKRIKEEV